ncbi:ABC transporter permease [Cohnella abietis]|uniref:ABC transporter permease n=1 Tax=Cohnella abietis TaxID=2507935 RepID=UPI00102EA380|nr:ABC transporter permease subunit [Cohnella abietis]
MSYTFEINKEEAAKVDAAVETAKKPGNKQTNRRWLRRFYKQRYLQIMALLGVAWIIVFNYVPMYGIIIAFKDYDIIGSISSAPWVGLDNFKEFFEDENLAYVVKNTLGISLLRLIIGFPLPILFAILLNEMRSARLKRGVQTISYLPYFLSWVILGGILSTWLADVGIINQLLLKLHFINEPISFLAEPSYFWAISIISSIWKELGWSAIIYLAAIASISPELHEAAKIDGAGRFQRIRHITLPSIAGTISILFILAVSGLLNSNFDQIMVLRNSLNESASNVIDIYIYQTGLQSARFSYSTAVGLVKSVIALVLLLVSNSVTKKINNTSLF